MKDRLVVESGATGIGAGAAVLLGELIPLLTSGGSIEEKLVEVARRLCLSRHYESVDFMVLEGESLARLRHHVVAFVPDQVAGAWEGSVQDKDALSAFPAFEAGSQAEIYSHVQTDSNLTQTEREMAALYGLGSVLVVPLLWDRELRGALAVSSKRESAFNAGDAEFLGAIASQVSALVRQQCLIEDLAQANDRIARLQDDTVMMLAQVAEAHDETTGRHLVSVRAVAELLAQELGYSAVESATIGQASVLHDIGKVRMNRRTLAKAGPLTVAERNNIEKHPIWGEGLLAGHAGFELAAQIARSHHERWDGTGYPDHLREDQIPIGAAITALADAFDAMISARPYKAKRPLEWAMQEIRDGSGKQFCPIVVQAMLRLFERGLLLTPDQTQPLAA